MEHGTPCPRGLLYAALEEVGSDVRNSTAGAAALTFASEASTRVALEAVQIYGGYGYMRDYPLERLARDAKLLEIGAGTSEIRRIRRSRGRCSDRVSETEKGPWASKYDTPGAPSVCGLLLARTGRSAWVQRPTSPASANARPSTPTLGAWRSSCIRKSRGGTIVPVAGGGRRLVSISSRCATVERGFR